MAKKRSSDYWKKRFEQLEQASHSYGQATYAEIEPAFTQAQRSIQAEIEVWYQRFADNNGVSMQEARRMLSARELAELKWDVNQYIQYGQQNALDGKWMKQLENASARFHISRLEALQIRTQQALEVAFGNELDAVDRMARKVFTEDYYHSIFEVQKGFNVGWEIGQIDQKELDKIVTKPWSTDGKNFSDRIWSRKQQMIGDLHQELTRTAIQGKSPDEAIKHMQQFVDGKVKNAKAAASRLVMTEQAYFHSVSQEEAFKDLDVEEFEIVATLDSHTSEVCQEMDGQHFPMKDYEPGVTAPPFHPNCRSVTAPYFEDNYGGERAARGEDGKTYYVPDNMTYKEWKDSLVEGNTEDLKPAEPDVKVKTEAPKIEPERPAFVPAESIEEAEEYARQFVVDKTWTGNGNVSFKGISLENANKINETLTGVYADMDVPKLRNIQPMNFRQNIFKNSKDAPFCYRSMQEGELYFNPILNKTRKTIQAYMDKGAESFQYCKEHLDLFKGEKRKLIETYITAGRQVVADSCDDFMKAMVEHELGHHIQHSIIFKDKDMLQIVKDGMDTYAIKLSGYATSSVGEYIAESFSAYRNGFAESVDPKLVEIFERLVKGNG